jgi:UDP:flavonoid glycosyltransferase YjiC (YdhE family)
MTRTISHAGLTAVPLGDRSPQTKADSPEPAEVVRFAEHWRPDLVIGEPSAAAGTAAVEATGAAHAQLLWRGDVDGVTGDFFIEQLPVSLQGKEYGHTVTVRHTPYAGPVTIHTWLWSPPRRPRVGLVPGNGVLAGLTESLADLDIEVVATNTDTGQHIVFPDNVRLGTAAPLDTLVPSCAAIIHDGSADTIATAALHGVPQLALPARQDQAELAERVSEYGAGLHISIDQSSGEQVRAALLRLLGEPSFLDGASRLRAEVLAMPTANEIVPHLAELTEKYRA